MVKRLQAGYMEAVAGNSGYSAELSKKHVDGDTVYTVQ